MSTTSINTRYVNCQQAAAILGVTDGRIRQLLRAGELVGLKVNERAWLIEKRHIEKYQKK